MVNRLPDSFSTQRRLNKKTLCGLHLHDNIAHTKFEREESERLRQSFIEECVARDLAG